jgi:hypothetical protein
MVINNLIIMLFRFRILSVIIGIAIDGKIPLKLVNGIDISLNRRRDSAYWLEKR